MKNYERPQILATYSIEELMQEAAVCHHYSWHSRGGGNGGPGGSSGNHGGKGGKGGK